MSAPISDAKLITAAIAKFDAANASKIRAVRAALRKRFPTAYELVYDNYNFFVIAYCTTERPSSSILSLAADANGITLMFYRGADVPDPHHVLEGNGKQNRFIRLPNGAADLKHRNIAAAIDAAEAIAAVPMRESGRIETTLRLVSPKQRPRRK